MTRRRRGAAVLALAAAALVVIIARLPTAAVCVASGRTVDPTGRHCVAADGSEGQLREHVLGHTLEVVAVAVALAVVALVARNALRAARRARRSQPS